MGLGAVVVCVVFGFGVCVWVDAASVDFVVSASRVVCWVFWIGAVVLVFLLRGVAAAAGAGSFPILGDPVWG